MHGILRVINASTLSNPNPFNRILLFTDAPPKDYNITDTVRAKLLPTGRNILHAFLPNELLQPCVPTWTDHECNIQRAHAYAKLVKASDGILVDRLTAGGFIDFIKQYNEKFPYGEPLEPVSCGDRKKRSTSFVPTCSSVVVSEFARQLHLVIVPQGSLVRFRVSQPPARNLSQFTDKTSTPRVLKWDNPMLGNWTVC